MSCITHQWLVILSLLTSYLATSLPAAEDVDLMFHKEPGSVLVSAGGDQSAVFKCSVLPKSAEIYWIRNGDEELDEDFPGVIQYSKHRLVVQVPSVYNNSARTFSRNGVQEKGDSYQCVARLNELVLISNPAFIIISELSSFPPTEDTQVTVIKGNTAIIPCSLPHSVPQAVAEFRFNNITIDRSLDRYHLMPSGNLQIEDARASDEGMYRCIAHNPFLKEKIESPSRVNLRVVETTRQEPSIFPLFPVSPVTGITGSNVTLECSAYGNPSPRIVWRKEIGHLPHDRHKYHLGNLQLFNIQQRDGGHYICRSDNDVGRSISSRIKLIVQEPPQIKHSLQNHVVPFGGEVKLDCPVRGNPTPKVTWYHNGRRVHHTSHITLHDTSIHVKGVTHHQSGIYQCFATNVLGSSFSRSIVSVLSPDDDLDESPDNDVSGKTDPDESDGLPEDGSKKAKEKGKKKKSKGVKLVPPSRPEVSRLSDNSVMVRWNVGQNDGLPILFFKVQYREVSSNESHWNTVDEDIAPHIHSYAVTGLKAGAKYRFRIAAVYSNNDNKLGQNSKKFVLHKDPPKRKPIRGPSITSIKAVSTSAIMLDWEYKDKMDPDPVEIEGFFIYYRLTQSAGDYLKVTVEGSETKSYIVSHLLPDTSYDIKMQCFNVAGTSEFSNIYTSKTLPKTEAEPKTTVESRPVVETRTSGKSNLLYIVLGVVLGAMGLVLGIFLILCIVRQRQQRRHHDNSSDHRHQQNGHIANGDYISAQSRIDITINPLHDSVELKELSREKYTAVLVTQLGNGHRPNSLSRNSNGAIIRAEDV